MKKKMPADRAFSYSHQKPLAFLQKSIYNKSCLKYTGH
ncbi:hypothetical protein CHCC14817_0405 [Bacillus paralicheniformis]|uniref:Uncharacterized protein n=1 Tax=Bacillus paralicheniformis TaxID=1648923 RepID=A0ABY3FQZ0_9BACI|nr:hypothetical protein CHCC5022_0359 [Bacillus paralicheniformis]TWJ68468.1 hypothetical protein CHCC4186_0004 [Bacillus paralicheniformis]TWL34446.1 hypothetical protein CHCC15381_0520 [Bacillus paralicheniformis]TWM10922.1 hypothetical protein CHCC15136_3621 [Bacillus paralicheniformis]TWM45744.1 hypothetical protein CHCC14817_0405 [Bacillus paralicheniformis]